MLFKIPFLFAVYLLLYGCNPGNSKKSNFNPLPPNNQPAVEDKKQLTVQNDFGCRVTKDFQLSCWAGKYNETPKIPDDIGKVVAISGKCTLSEQRELLCWNDKVLPGHKNFGKVDDFSWSKGHFCFIDQTKKGHCYDSNNFATEISVPETWVDLKIIRTHERSICSINESGKASCIFDNQLERIPTIPFQIKDISLTSKRLCTISTDDIFSCDNISLSIGPYDGKIQLSYQTLTIPDHMKKVKTMSDSGQCVITAIDNPYCISDKSDRFLAINSKAKTIHDNLNLVDDPYYPDAPIRTQSCILTTDDKVICEGFDYPALPLPESINSNRTFLDICLDPNILPQTENLFIYLKSNFQSNDCETLNSKLQTVQSLDFSHDIESRFTVARSGGNWSTDARRWHISGYDLIKWSNNLPLIADISPLKEFTNILSLNLQGNMISDTSILENFVHLTHLNIMGTEIKNLDFLESLPNLKSLSIGGNDISDLSPISHLKNLESLEIWGVLATSDWIFPNSLDTVKNLRAYSYDAKNKVPLNYDFLKYFENIEDLEIREFYRIDRNLISKMGKSLKKVRNVKLINVPNENLHGLEHLTAIESLIFEVNHTNGAQANTCIFTDLSELVYLKNLTHLKFDSSCQIKWYPPAMVTCPTEEGPEVLRNFCRFRWRSPRTSYEMSGSKL